MRSFPGGQSACRVTVRHLEMGGGGVEMGMR